MESPGMLAAAGRPCLGRDNVTVEMTVNPAWIPRLCPCASECDSQMFAVMIMATLPLRSLPFLPLAVIMSVRYAKALSN